MNQKGKKFVVMIVLFLILIIVGSFLYKDYKNSIQQENNSKVIKRHDEILKQFTAAVHRQMEAVFVIHDDYNCSHFIKGHHTSDDLINQDYLKREDMLDMDKKTYCRGVATTYLDNRCQVQYKIDIKCKNFKTPDFDKQDYNSYFEWK